MKDRRNIIIGIILGLLFGGAQFLRFIPAKAADQPKQFVLTVVGSQNTDKLVISNSPIVLRLQPYPGTTPAPLNPMDLMICRAHDAKDQKDSTVIVMKCGLDKYVLVGLNFTSLKGK